MALTATMYRFQVSVSDVDRGVYTTLDLRVAQHPSESLRFLMTRTLAYCLSWEEGIAFSKGGISSTDEPPVSVHDATGLLVAWIDVGSPSAERLHKATKYATRVALYTTAELSALKREAANIHKAEGVEVFRIEQRLVDELAERIARNLAFELTRSDGHLYVTLNGETLSGSIEPERLVDS